ncbi:hypothetical protein ACUXEY_000570, partial [Bacillus sp. F9_6S_D1_P_5]
NLSFSSFLSVLTHKKRFRHKNRLWRRLSPQPEKEIANGSLFYLLTFLFISGM